MSDFLLALGLLLALFWGYRLMVRLEAFIRKARFTEDDDNGKGPRE